MSLTFAQVAGGRMSWFRFARSALRQGHAYIDFDGTLAYSVTVEGSFVPGGPSDLLTAWKEKVHAAGRGRLILPRLCFLLALRALGVRLHVWTNRGPEMRQVTQRTLGRWSTLFDSMEFHGGKKGDSIPAFGPVLDDEPKYIELAASGSLLVTRR
jgi:hypothetical protein